MDWYQSIVPTQVRIWPRRSKNQMASNGKHKLWIVVSIQASKWWLRLAAENQTILKLIRIKKWVTITVTGMAFPTKLSIDSFWQFRNKVRQTTYLHQSAKIHQKSQMRLCKRRLIKVLAQMDNDKLAISRACHNKKLVRKLWSNPSRSHKSSPHV